jgi:hypothetical protein
LIPKPKDSKKPVIGAVFGPGVTSEEIFNWVQIQIKLAEERKEKEKSGDGAQQ